MWYWDCGPDVSQWTHRARSHASTYDTSVLCCALCELLVSWNQSLKEQYIVNHYLAARIVLWHSKQQREVSNATMANAGRKNKLLQCFTWGPDPYPEGSGLLFLCFNIFPSAGRNWKNWIKTCGYLDFASLFDWTSSDWALSTYVCEKMWRLTKKSSRESDWSVHPLLGLV